MELRGHTDQINSLAWDPSNANRLASVSADKTVRLWDIKSGRIAHSHDGNYIAVSNSESISLIDTRKNRVVRRVVNPCEVRSTLRKISCWCYLLFFSRRSA